MLYRLLYIPAKFAIRIYCRHIAINKKENLSLNGPLLIAANHPNSFLDAIILSTLFDRPVYSLARGDAFSKPIYKKLLMSLNMFPVYRISEGAENLGNNYDTFENCREIFRKNGIVLIFSEGRCINEWKLRPLKKGTARLAQSSWQEGIPLKILPAGINYQSFTSFGKNVQLNFGSIITESDIGTADGFGKTIIGFNERLRASLQELVIEADETESSKVRTLFHIPVPVYKKILLFLPASAGYVIHAPLYIPLKKLSHVKGRHNDHFDSLLVGLLFISYPVYLALAAAIVYLAWGDYWWACVFILLPFCAWSFVQLKKQF